MQTEVLDTSRDGSAAPSPGPAWRSRLRAGAGRAWPLAVFLLTVAAFTGPALSRGAALAGSDIVLAESPYRAERPTAYEPGNPLQLDQAEQVPFVLEFWESARAGRFQAWEPDAGGGMPLGLAVHTRVLAPWNAVLLVVPGATGITLSTALGLLVCQLGTFWLARRLGLGRPGAVVAAVAYTFSGPVLVFLLRIHEVLVFPALLAALHGAVTEASRRGRYILASAAAVTTTLLAGFPGAGLMAMYAAACWVAYLVVEELLRPQAVAAAGGGWARVRRAAAGAGAAGAGAMGGAALAAPVLLPSYAFLAVTGSLERGYPLSHRAGLAQLATLVSGRLLGTFQERTWWWPEDYYSNPFEASVTAGLVVLALVSVLVVRGLPDGHPASRPLRRYLVPLGLLVLGATYLGGPALWLAQRFPLVALNGVGRARFMLSLALALAAGLGVERLVAWHRARVRVPGRRGGERPDVRGGSVALRVELGVVLVLGAVGLNDVYLTALTEDTVDRLGAGLVVPGLVLGAAVLAALLAGRWGTVLGVLLAGLVAVELQWGAWGFTPPSPPEALAPDVPAFAVLEEGTGPGGPWRFFGLGLDVARPHAAVLADLTDARMAFPALEAYRDLLQIADPGIWDTGRLKTYVTDAFDPRSPALDAAAVRYLTVAHEAGPLEVGAPVFGPEPGQVPRPLPRPVGAPPRPGTYRSVTVPVRLRDPGCARGWLELTDGVTTSRRLLRTTGPRPTFLLPDVRVTANRPWTLSSTDCPVALGTEPVYWQPPAEDTVLEVVSVEGWTVYERRRALPRASLAEAVARVPDAEARRAALSRRAPGGPVLVSEPIEEGPRGGGTVRLVRDSPDRVVVATDSDGPGLLVLRDARAPGWRASVDGRPAPILTADHAFRGVEVPDGPAAVTFSYEPEGFVRGRLLAVAGGAALVLLAGLPPAARWAGRWRSGRSGRGPGASTAGAGAAG